jgi:predicted DNA-binding transcriptional regulator AlpA
MFTKPLKKTAAATAKGNAIPEELIALNLKHHARAGLAAEESPRRSYERERVHGARAAPRLLSKHEVLDISGCTYPTLWAWMRAGKFPRSRIVGGKSMWLSSEIDAWLEGLPVRPLKGDKPEPCRHA